MVLKGYFHLQNGILVPTMNVMLGINQKLISEDLWYGPGEGRSKNLKFIVAVTSFLPSSLIFPSSDISV